MAQETYNDVTVAWTPTSSTIVTVLHTSVTLEDSAAAVDTTDATDDDHTADDGIASLQCTVRFSGSGDGLELGDTGALAIANMTGSIANGAIFEKTVEGSEDGTITGSVVILPTPAPS